MVWDVRCVGKPAARRYPGHVMWIKNCEPVGAHTVVSASFDGTLRVWDVRAEDGLPKDVPVLPLPGYGSRNVVFFHPALRRAVVWSAGRALRLVVSVGDALLSLSDVDVTTVASALWGARDITPHPAVDDVQGLPGPLRFDPSRMYAPVLGSGAAAVDAATDAGTVAAAADSAVSSSSSGGSSGGGGSSGSRGGGAGSARDAAHPAPFGPVVECLDEPPGATTLSLGFSACGQLLVTRRVADFEMDLGLMTVPSRPSDEVSVLDLSSRFVRGGGRVLGRAEATARGFAQDRAGTAAVAAAGSDAESSLSDGSDADSDGGDDDAGGGVGRSGSSSRSSSDSSGAYVRGSAGGGAGGGAGAGTGASGLEPAPLGRSYGRRVVRVVDRTLLRLPEACVASSFIKGAGFSGCGNFVASPYYAGARVFSVAR
jgi:hypothetical protein